MSCHPQTPQSPSKPSPNTSEFASTASSTTAPTTTTLPTPAHSVTECALQPGDMYHDRTVVGPGPGPGSGPDTPNKRKRAVDDQGDQASKKVHMEPAKLGIEDLHLDVGDKYLLCRTPHAESFPRTSEDLFDMFNLSGLALEVAREKPSGEKNALRKTYKGHIKRLGILGHFDAVRKENSDPSGFMAMLDQPEHEWNIHCVTGRDLLDGLSEQALACIGKAMTMVKGPIPKTVWDGAVLGDMAPDPPRQTGSGKPTAPNTPALATAVSSPALGRAKLQASPDPQAAQQKPPAQDGPRPKRNMKKRGYGDSSFEGYGEGFPDDDPAAADAGYSTAEGEDRPGQKRRHKNPPNPQSQSPYPGPIRQTSFGPSVVGA